MKTIELKENTVALVSDSDYKSCLPGARWFADPSYRADGTLRTMYAIRHVQIGIRKYRKEYLHRFLLGVTDSSIRVDHRDGNGLNCQRRNIRIATHSQNCHNRPLVRGKHSRGVWFDPNRRGTTKYGAHIGNAGKNEHLGWFSTERKAANAYDLRAVQIHGKFALTNRALRRRDG